MYVRLANVSQATNLGKEEATVTLLFTWEVTNFKQKKR